MKFLAPVRLRRPTESRYTTDDYLQWMAQAWGSGGMSQGAYGVHTTTPARRIEPIEPNFEAFTSRGLKGNGVVWTCNAVRLEVFSQAQFKWRKMSGGRPGKVFGTAALAPLESPWPGGTTGQLLARMITDVDLAGNFYGARTTEGLVRLRPDWVDIVMEPLETVIGPLGWRKVGYAYHPEGDRGTVTPLLPHEVVHFAPKPDPLANWRGMSWLTPVLREISGDTAYSDHKLQFMGNAATPNLSVVLPKEVTVEQFDAFKERMEASHKGTRSAGKTLFLGGGADVSVIGSDMRQLDFKVVQGAGETRVAAASGVGAVIAQFSEGMQGSSLNAGNYAASRRRFADVTMRHLWQECCAAIGALDPPLVRNPAGAALWYLADDIPFLQEDAKDAADIVATNAQAIRQLVEAGFEPATAVTAVDERDVTGLSHTGVFSVQLQPPGSGEPTEGAPAATDAQQDDKEGTDDD